MESEIVYEFNKRCLDRNAIDTYRIQYKIQKIQISLLDDLK